MATRKTATKKTVTHVKVEVEQRHYSSTGKRKSTPFVQSYTPEDWTMFVESGPKLGYFVNEVLEMPEGVTLQYVNPGDEKKSAK